MGYLVYRRIPVTVLWFQIEMKTEYRHCAETLGSTELTDAWFLTSVDCGLLHGLNLCALGRDAGSNQGPAVSTRR